MSLFTCLKALKDLKALYCDDAVLCPVLENFEARIKLAESKNDSLALISIVTDLKTNFAEVENLAFFSPVLWLPLERFSLPQKIKSIITELDACAQAGRRPSTGYISAFQLPSIKAPYFCNTNVRTYYEALHDTLSHFYNKADTEYLYQKWSDFKDQTEKEKEALVNETSSWWHRHQANQYFEVRQGVQNQMALAYLFHEHQQAAMNYEADWRQGSSKQSGYGYVMSMALPEHNPADMTSGQYVLNDTIANFELNRLDKNKDQAKIKHNRITPLLVATTMNRAKALLDLAKENEGNHLNIKLLSRGISERYSYLQYPAGTDKHCLFFCDPKYGLFKFNNDAEFLFFYQMLYAKEEMQTGLCWNRYQVSHMRYAPVQAVLFTWAGRFRSLFSGLKYNTSLWDRAKNYVLFNVTLFLCLTEAYMRTGIITVISPFIGALLLVFLVQNYGATILSATFTFGSSGLLSAPDFIYALCLNIGDQLKWLVGMRRHFDAILHTQFDLDDANLERVSSHYHLLKKLGPQDVLCENRDDHDLLNQNSSTAKMSDVARLVSSTALADDFSLPNTHSKSLF